ncbi:hypothetical protein [Persephonella sp.]
MTTEIEQTIIDKIKETFERLGVSSSSINIPDLQGKTFELYSLSDIIEELEIKGFNLKLIPINGNVQFANKPSKLDRSRFSHIRLYRNREKYELWMDIEFIGISGDDVSLSLETQIFRKNFVHELDIAVLENNIPNGERPTYKEIHLAVECKDTQNFGKSILKQILGIRRELSLLSDTYRNKITNNRINQNPPTEFWIYSSNPSVNNLQHVGNFWELKFKYLNLNI